jgi:hypothetical protein
MWSLLTLAHLIGLALALGAASAKLVLLLKARADHAFVPTFLEVARPITKLIILGLVLLTLSGIGFVLTGYHFTPRLVVKLVLVGAVWALGPLIDNAIEPEFRKLAPKAGESTTPAFVRIQNRYVLVEAIATGLFYVIVLMWVR